MAQLLLVDWQSAELPHINQALMRAVKALPEPCRPVAMHILNAGGKRLRPLLAIACARLFAPVSSRIYPLASSMELLHAATLLHDDILDNASQRRGEPAAHTVFGMPQTVLAGDALLAQGNAIVASYDSPLLVTCYSKATIETAAGEIREMEAIRNPHLDNAQYLEIIRGKTGCLIAQSCLLGAIYGGATSRQCELCLIFGENLGIAFQIIDDALDFMPQSETGKPQGGDLREGKLTPPLRFYRQSLSETSRKEFDRNFIHAAFSCQELEEIACKVCEFIPHVTAMAINCLDKARAALNELPAGTERDILAEMVTYVGTRRR